MIFVSEVMVHCLFWFMLCFFSSLLCCCCRSDSDE